MDEVRVVVSSTISEISERWKRRVNEYRQALSDSYDRDEIDQVDEAIAVLSAVAAARGKTAAISREELHRLAFLAQCEILTQQPGDIFSRMQPLSLRGQEETLVTLNDG